MVGRDRELAAVLAHLTAPEVGVTLLVGDAGIGKSRLVAEVVAASPERLTWSAPACPCAMSSPF